MARIAFLSLVFPPDSVSTAQIMGDLAEDLVKLGHSVEVLTTTPHYNRDLEAESRQPLRKYWGVVIQKSNYRGIPVYHVIMPQKGASIPARLLAWFGFHVISTIAGIFLLSKPDILVVPSPPLTIGLSAWLLGRMHHARFVYNVQEIYPDYAISLGAIRNKWLIRLLYKLESFVYKKASAITVIAPHMADQLKSKNVPSHKVVIIPNFVDVEELKPLSKDNDFSRKYSIHDKFVISYAGNMGPSQDLGTFVEAAALLQGHSNIHFMMMGDGMLREQLKQQVERLRLSNFTYLVHQPYSLVSQIYAASDLCLVPQGPGIAGVAVPSKVYRIMSCERPVLAATVPESDLANLIKTSGCGIVVDAGSSEKLADSILIASNSKKELEAMGKNGRLHVAEYYSRQAISKRYNELILSLAVGKGVAQ